MNDRKLKPPTIPGIYRRKIVDAIRRVEVNALSDEIDKSAFDLLDEYRRNRATGITNPAYVRSIPPSLLSSLELLDETLCEAHNINNADLFCKATVSCVMKKTRELSTRTPAYDYQAIRAEAAKLGYWDAPRGKKKQVRAQIIKNLKLDQGNPTAAENLIKTVERILGAEPEPPPTIAPDGASVTTSAT